MSIQGVKIRRGKVGAGSNALADAESGLLASGVAVVADPAKGIAALALGTAVKLTSLVDAAAYGITAAYDSTNKVRVFRHIDEFYRMVGYDSGIPLWLMLYPVATTPVQALGDTYAKAMVAQSGGNMRQLALAYSPAPTYVATYVDGLEDNIRQALPAAQLFYEWAFDTYRPCQILVEGRGFNATSAALALDLRAITVTGNIMEYYKVTLCIGQDWNYAETQDAVGKKMADVGTLLGTVAALPVHRNAGETETQDLSDTVKNRWLLGGLSNHSTIVDWEAQLSGLDAKGYVFGVSYTGYAGKYWNDDHTCTPVKADDDGNLNENSISLGRVHDKACRVLRTSLMPKVKSTQPVDPTTGLLPKSIVTYFEEMGDTAFDKNMKGEISYAKTTVDGSSNLLVAPKELKCSFVVVPQGQVGSITGTINLKTSV